MAENSKIEWTDATWNPIAGCSVVSPGCANCYAMRKVAPRLAANPATPHYHGTVQPSKAGPVWTGKIGVAADDAFLKPLRWRKPREIFVNSTSDLFHEDVPDAVIDRVFAVMALTPQHTYQVLTKRAARMQAYLVKRSAPDEHGQPAEDIRVQLTAWLSTPSWRKKHPSHAAITPRGRFCASIAWPLPNVWLGVSVEDQNRADERIPHLLATPAAVRFLSCEPLLGPVDLTLVTRPQRSGYGPGVIDALRGWTRNSGHMYREFDADGRIHWVICGGESGSGARPMHPAWARSLRDQCAAAKVPFHFKQWGDWSPGDDLDEDVLDGAPFGAFVSDTQFRRDLPQDMATANEIMFRVGKKVAGRLLDGREWNETPRTADNG